MEASKTGRDSALAELLREAEVLGRRAALLLAEAVRVQRTYEHPWRETDPLTSTQMGLPDH